jgi:hypothetical protein
VQARARACRKPAGAAHPALAPVCTRCAAWPAFVALGPVRCRKPSGCVPRHSASVAPLCRRRLARRRRRRLT